MNRTATYTRVVLGVSISTGLLLQVLTAEAPAGGSRQTGVPDDQGKQLRDVFQGTDTSLSFPGRTVGRLAILLKSGDGFIEVKPTHSFQSGDRFRFSVAANRDGWLYVMHAGPDGVMKQLWPRKQDDNAIKAHTTYEIPPQPGIFIFDKSIGQERFYVAIRSTPAPPDLSPLPPLKKTPAPAKTKAPAAMVSKKDNTEINNFDVRDPFGETDRGIVFDPGGEDNTPYLYFSTVAEDKLKSAAIEFTLNHVE